MFLNVTVNQAKKIIPKHTCQYKTNKKYEVNICFPFTEHRTPTGPALLSLLCCCYCCPNPPPPLPSHSRHISNLPLRGDATSAPAPRTAPSHSFRHRQRASAAALTRGRKVLPSKETHVGAQLVALSSLPRASLPACLLPDRDTGEPRCSAATGHRGDHKNRAEPPRSDRGGERHPGRAPL